jgi:hypothetical protein
MSKLQLPKNIGKGTAQKIENLDAQYYDPSHHAGFFPFGIYFTQKFKTFPCIIHINKTYSEDLIEFLRKKGELLQDTAVVKNTSPRATSTNPYSDDYEFSDDTDDYKGVFLYKNSVIAFNKATTRKNRHKNEEVVTPLLFNISVYYEPNTEPPLKDFDKFLYEEKFNSVIHTIFRDDQGSIIFEPFETIVPKNFSVEKYYKPDFIPVHEHIVNSLKKDESGLYLLHGEPGTGKTTYIKYLSSIINRDMIYVPVAFIDSIIDPSFLPSLLKKKHSILVIEDAEKALLSREPGDSSSLVSAILNITDGIMGNVFNISVIATYNSRRQDIDKALLRKGRLKGEYKFDKLPVEQCQEILNSNSISFTAKEPMALAEIFNTEEPDVVTTKELVEEKRMGFC